MTHCCSIDYICELNPRLDLVRILPHTDCYGITIDEISITIGIFVNHYLGDVLCDDYLVSGD